MLAEKTGEQSRRDEVQMLQVRVALPIHAGSNGMGKANGRTTAALMRWTTIEEQLAQHEPTGMAGGVQPNGSSSRMGQGGIRAPKLW